MLLLLYWMGTLENLDATEGGGWGIYSLQPLPSCWLSLLAMGTPDSPVANRTCTVHCVVRATSARSLGFGAGWPLEPLSCSCTGQSGAFWLLCSDSCAHCSLNYLLLQSTIAPSDRCSAGSPDMSGAHRIVWWILAERAQRIPESGWFALSRAWCIGHCPMRHLAAHSPVFAPNLFESPTEFLSWFVLNLMHLR
jgi:hypothetical protein